MKKSTNKITVFTDKAVIDWKVNAITKGQEQLQALVSEYLSISIIGSKGIATDELGALAGNPQGFVKSKIASLLEVPMMAGFPMKADVLINNLELPDTDKLQNISNQLNETIEKGKIDLSYYSLEGKDISINEERVQQMKDSNTVYAETPEEIEVFNVYDNLRKGIADFNALVKTRLGSDEVQTTDPKRYLKFNHEIQNFDFNLPAYQRLVYGGGLR